MRASLGAVLLSALVTVLARIAAANPSGPPDAAPSPQAPPPNGAPSPAAPHSAPQVVIVAPSVGPGVAPGVLATIADTLRASAAELGYSVASEADTRTALLRAGLNRVDSASHLWHFMHAADAHHAVVARVRVAPGHYVIEIQLAHADGTGPFSANGSASPDTLGPATRALLPTILRPVTPLPSVVLPAPVVPAPDEALRSWRLAAQTDAAFGVYDGYFYNQMVGGRLDWRVTRRLALGPYFAYVNLKGRTGREHGALGYVQLDSRFDLGSQRVVQAVTRAAMGYFVRNGPMLRIAAGLAFSLGNGHEVVVDLVTPTLWVARDRTLLSLDAALEVGFQL